MGWAAAPGTLAALAAVTVGQGVLPVAAAWATRLLLDGVAAAAPGEARQALALLLAATLAIGLLPHVDKLLTSRLRRKVELLVQARLFAAVNRLPGLEPFEQPAFHDRLELAEQAGQVAPGRAVLGAFGLLQGTITVGGFLVALALLDWRIAAAALLAAAPGLVAELQMSRLRAGLLWDLSPARRRALAYGAVQSDERAAKEIRVFGIGGFLLDRMTGLIRAANDHEERLDVRELRMQLLLGVVGTTGLAVALALVVGAALSGQSGVGDVVLGLVALAGVQAGTAGVTAHAADVHAAAASLAHYEFVLQAAREHDDGDGHVAPLRHDLTFADVWFRYDDGHPWVLRGVDLVIPQGSSVALVGSNGAGKSTLVKLTCRLYDPVRGAVLWDGVDLRDLPRNALRRRISAVFQDFMAYDLTAAENIGVGDLARADDPARLVEAAARAGVDSALQALPQGYDTLLSRRFFGGEQFDDPAGEERAGVLLSGGQWQRVAIARSLLRSACDLLILDEPSSGLDAKAEHALQDELRQLRRGRTTLTISHRLSIAREADLVVVLEEGRVVERGTHAELIAAAGRYAELFRLQAAGYGMEQPDPQAEHSPA